MRGDSGSFENEAYLSKPIFSSKQYLSGLKTKNWYELTSSMVFKSSSWFIRKKILNMLRLIKNKDTDFPGKE